MQRAVSVRRGQDKDKEKVKSLPDFRCAESLHTSREKEREKEV